MNTFWDNTKVTKNMEKVSTILPMEISILVIGLMIRRQVKAFSFSLMVIGTRRDIHKYSDINFGNDRDIRESMMMIDEYL
jgi:hypothetical protein